MLAGSTVDASQFTGVKNVGSVGGGSILTVTNGDIASLYSVTNENTGGGGNNVTVGGISAAIRATQTSGLTTALNFSVNNAGVRTGSTTAGLVVNNATLTSGTLTGVEIVNVATTGTNFIVLTGLVGAGIATDLATVNVTGNGNNTINAQTMTNTTTYNLGTSTGTNVLNMVDGLQSITTITGGTGADTLQTSVTGTIGALTVTGVETLRVAANAGNTTLAFATPTTFTTVRIDADGGETNQLVNASFANLTFVGAGSTATSGTAQAFDAFTSTGGFTGTSDTLAMTVGNQGTALAAGIGYNLGALTLNGVETLAITVSDTNSTGATTIAGLTATTLSSITITNPGNVTLGEITSDTGAGANRGSLTSINLAGVTGTNVSTFSIATNTVSAATFITASTAGTQVTAVAANDAGDSIFFTGGAGPDVFVGTGFLGLLSLIGGNGADTLTGGSGADVIVGGEGANILRGGLAADTISVVQTVAAFDTVIFETNVTFDTVTGFTIGAAATTDQADLLLASFNAIVVDMSNGAGASIAADDAVDFSAAIAAAGATFAAGDNIILVSETTAAGVLTAIQASAFAADATPADGDGIFVVWVDANADLHISVAVVQITDQAIDTAVITDVAVLTGTYTLAGLATNNFDFI